MDNDEIRKKVWEGHIPICFKLANNEIISFRTPHPYYVMVPRQSYLSIYRKEIRDHFVDFTSSFDKKDDVWFEYKDEPLQWNIPAGVLFDLKNENEDLPWNITAHFNSFPTEKLMRITTEEDSQWNYINTLKEAIYVRYGTTQPVMTLSKIDQTNLWDSITTCSFGEYEKLKKKVLVEGEVKKYPIRVFESETAISHLFLVDNLKMTLSEFITTFMKSKIDSKIFVQGITPSLDTPLEFLFETSLHPDYLLYVILK